MPTLPMDGEPVVPRTSSVTLDQEAAHHSPLNETEAATPRNELTAALKHGAIATRLGRYIILDLLGSGGMGMVFSAFDPQLDRRVAVKVLKAGVGSEVDRQRLLREAKAMAKLTHPNVVGVYDAGEESGQSYVAMEFVRGASLRSWLVRKRSWRETLAVFQQAGQGLRAAHEAGLVHRDFKPDNVLMTDDGVAKVADFGLARAGGATASEPVTIGEADTLTATRGILTRDGMLVGTPAYMSPEQYLGLEADPRSDQFSFFVSLHEAMHGERPFEGTTMPELAANVTSGRRRPRAASSSVPIWVDKVIDRGLRARRDERWPTMAAALEALSAALAHDPKRRRRRILLGVTVISVLVAVILAYRGLVVRSVNERQILCSGAFERLVGVWDPERREHVQQAFLATKLPYAKDVWNHVAARLDEHAEAWAQMHMEACQATHIRGEQSSALLDLRMACLQRHLTDMRLLVNVFLDADADVVENAAQATAALKDLGPCADTTSLLRGNSSAMTPEQAALAVEIRDQLAQARALEATVRLQAGLALADSAWQRAQALDNKSLLAEVRLVQGVILGALGDPRAEETLADAFYIAESTDGDAQVLVQAALELTHRAQSRFNATEAEQWLRHARALVSRRKGTHPAEGRRHEIELSFIAGNVDVLAGRLQEAETEYSRALEIADEVPGDMRMYIANVSNNLGNLFVRRGDLERASDELGRAASIYREMLGPRHPIYGIALNNLGEISMRRESLEQARTIYVEAKSVLLDAFGPQHPHVGIVSNNLGEVALRFGDYASAVEHFNLALEILSASFGPDAPALSYPLNGLGESMIARGQPQAAREILERALALRNNEGSTEQARTRFALARALPPDANARALELASQAAKDFATAGPGYTRELFEVSEWLRTRTPTEGRLHMQSDSNGTSSLPEGRSK